MEDLTIRLDAVSDSYYGFIVAVLTYVKKKQSRYNKVNDYLNSHPQALSSEILEFISSQDDFFEDAAYNQVNVV